MTLIAGATGMPGSEICRLLRAQHAAATDPLQHLKAVREYLAGIA